MADDGILGLLGRLNDPNALYQGALSDPATQQAMAGRGLLAMAGSFADSAMPTRMPTPIGAVLGHAAGALGTSQDAVMDARLKAAQAQLAGSTVGLQNLLGPAYQAQIEAARRALERQGDGAPGGGIPTPPAPGTATPGLLRPSGPAPTGPISPDLVTWHAKNLGLDPLIAHTTADIESSYGANTGNKVSPSNTGVYQRAKADAPGGMNDTLDNQISLGIGDLVSERNDLRARLGREPTNAEVYLAHQQGPDGATKLINNPDTPAGQLVRPINISNNKGDPKAPASAFVQHWEQAYNGREAKFASGTLTPPGPTLASGGGPAPGAPGGLLNLPEVPTGGMNAPIPGIPSGVAPGAPGPGPAAVAPGTPAAAAVPPPSAGDILTALSQRTQAAGGPGPRPPGLPLMADASGRVPLPAGPPPGPAAPAPNLVPGGKAITGLLGDGAAVPAGPPPPGAAGPPPGQPPGLLGPQQPGPQQPPVPPIAQPQAPAPASAAPPMAGPPVAPAPLNLPMPPPMPGGVMGPPVQPTPAQMIAQGIAGISALIGKPAPEYMQKLAGQPLEMQMEAYKAYIGAQANQLTARYQKDLDAHAARFIAFETSQGNLPADLTKMTTEQNLKLRNDMIVQHGLVQGSDGHWNIDPTWLNAQAQKAYATARGPAEFKTVTIEVPDDPANPNGPKHKQTMSEADFRDWQSGRGGPPGAGTGTAGIISGTGGTGTGGTAGAAPGVPGSSVYTPGQESELKARGDVLGAEYKQVAGDAVAADKAKPYLLAIRHAVQIHDTTGAGDAARLDAWKAVQSAAQMVGIPISEGLQDWIAKGEIIGKGSTHLGFQLARTIGGGSHEAQGIIDQAVKNNPGLGTSPQGNQDLLNLLDAVTNRAMDQRKFYDDYFAKKGTYGGAATAYNEQNPWEVTMSQFAPYQAAKMGGGDKAAAKAEYDKLPPGVKILKSDGSGYFFKPGVQ